MTTPTRDSSMRRNLGSGGARAARFAALLITALLTWGAAAPRNDDARPQGIREAGLVFEAARLLPEAERAAGLDEAERLAGLAQKGSKNDEENQAARHLWAQIQLERGAMPRASEGFRQAADKGAYADDAEFQSILVLEATGQDKEAVKAWSMWERSHPQSPLAGEARIAQAWNALRRGDTALAQRHLAGLLALRSWYAADPRVQLARATALYQTGKAA